MKETRTSWGYYGRSREFGDLQAILARERWCFARISGRRRIGKTTLVQHALAELARRPILYVQIPDSAGHDSMETFGLGAERFPWPDSLLGLAKTPPRFVREPRQPETPFNRARKSPTRRIRPPSSTHRAR